MNEDIFINGIATGYTCWIYHGEYEPPSKRARKDSGVDSDADSLSEMIRELRGPVIDDDLMMDEGLDNDEHVNNSHKTEIMKG